MSYDLFFDGQMIGRFESPEAALAHVRQEVQAHPEREFEIRDSETGKPYAPAASRAWREQLANKLGY